MSAGRMTLLALFGALFLWLAAGALSGHDRASAQGCTSGCGAPPPPSCGSCGPPAPPPKPPTCNTCGGGNHNINIPGINVYVAPSVVVNANVSANVNNSINVNAQNNASSINTASAFGGATANAWANANSGSNATATGGSAATGYGTGFGYGACCGGGGQSFYSPPMATGMIQGLVVENRQVPRTRRVAYEASRTRTRKVVIQAYCLDDRDVPHPASQVTPDRDIDDLYDGELYRCIAGARMQYVVADFNGRISFDGGQTIVCAKNEALYHSPGGRDGAPQVSCRPQKPARDCNERSLLRRFGAGVKILAMVTTEKYTAYREETVMEASAQTVITTMSLDGGVGGVAY